ncbi:MAG: ATP synthase F1 subunit gamma [Candidatus Aminicenantales bacterium]
MPALIDLRRRIKSVSNTRQITQAMKAVSTAKFKKAQRSVLEGRPHWHNLPGLLERVTSWAGRQISPILDRREERKIDALIISSDKGLCGAFNSNLMAKAAEFLAANTSQAEAGLFLVGRKAVNFFRKSDFAVVYAYTGKIDKVSLGDLKEIARNLMRRYVFAQTDAVYVVYNEFKSILAPRITIARILPVLEAEEEETPALLPPDWEPEPERLLHSLLLLYVETQVAHAFFESLAAEQAARMMAMENAARNADELISDLTLVMNKIRQSTITKELLEIMTAVEALAK